MDWYKYGFILTVIALVAALVQAIAIAAESDGLKKLTNCTLCIQTLAYFAWLIVGYTMLWHLDVEVCREYIPSASLKFMKVWLYVMWGLIACCCCTVAVVAGAILACAR